MSGHGNASTSVTIGDVNVAAGATAILGINQIGQGKGDTSAKLRDCTNALFITDPKVDRNELLIFKGERVKGTGEWIRQDGTYKAWLNSGDSRLLWISGGPGRGKTMLSIFLTVELQIFFRRPLTRILFYFCKHESENHNTATSILRTLLYQIFDKQPELTRHVASRMETAERTRDTLNSPGTLWQIFLNVLADPSLGPVVYLLDGLDECKDESTKWLVKSLQTIFDQSGRARLQTPNMFKVIVVSREITGLLGFPRLDLESKTHDIASDVRQVIESKIRNHPDSSRKNRAFWNKTVTAIQERCDGTFLWAGLVLNEILEKNTELEIEQVLLDVPEGLDAIYARILRSIPAKWRKQVARLLHWVTLAFMPLCISQLEDAWNTGRRKDDIKHYNLRDLVEMSRSLLKIDGSEERLLLVHSSVGDYLLRPTTDTDPVLEELRMEAKTIHFEMAKTCLSSINGIDLKRKQADLREEIQHCKVLHPVGWKIVRCERNFRNWISYAVYCWDGHARSCGQAAKELLDSTTPFFHNKTGLRDMFWDFFKHPLSKSRDGNVTCGVHTNPSLLHVLSALGIPVLVCELLSRESTRNGDYINLMTDQGHTALYYAVYYAKFKDQEDTVQALLDNGACVTRGYRLEGSALHAAFMMQNYRLAKLLLDHVCNDACMLSVPGQQRAPESLSQDLLYHAFCARDVRLVELLYDNGMGTRFPTSNMIMGAIVNASLPVFQYLLKQTFDVDAKNEVTGETYVMCAASTARRDDDAVHILKALLERGAKVNEPWFLGMTPLHMAVVFNNGAVIPTLLAHGADVNAVVHGAWEVRNMDTIRGQFTNAERFITAVLADGVRPVDSALADNTWGVAETILDASIGAKETLHRYRTTLYWLHCRMERRPVDGDDTGSPMRFCEKFLRRGPKANDRLWRSTLLDNFCEPLFSFQLDYIQLLLHYGAHCRLPENTERLQKVLERRFQNGMSAEEWDKETRRKLKELLNNQTA
uniref:Ankyrin repeat protein n=1 Tax=Colletotrichum fructicola (strain Nara gc5) TaxID=1213859 RepID=L2GDP1_COLFN